MRKSRINYRESTFPPSMSICEYGVSKLVTLREFNKMYHFSFFLCDFPPIHGAISTEVWQCPLPLLLGIVYSLHKSARKGHEKGKNPRMTSSLFLSKEIIMLKVEQNHRKSWTTVFLIIFSQAQVSSTHTQDIWEGRTRLYLDILNDSNYLFCTIWFWQK